MDNYFYNITLKNMDLKKELELFIKNRVTIYPNMYSSKNEFYTVLQSIFLTNWNWITIKKGNLFDKISWTVILSSEKIKELNNNEFKKVDVLKRYENLTQVKEPFYYPRNLKEYKKEDIDKMNKFTKQIFEDLLLFLSEDRFKICKWYNEVIEIYNLIFDEKKEKYIGIQYHPWDFKIWILEWEPPIEWYSITESRMDELRQNLLNRIKKQS